MVFAASFSELAPGDVTDSIVVSLFGNGGEAGSLVEALQTLKCHGEIAAIDTIHGSCPLMFTARFFDVRSAASAAASLGVSASLVPGSGDHKLQLSGDMELEPWMVNCVSAIKPHNSGSGFDLEFFDSRDCKRVVRELEPKASARQSPMYAEKVAASTSSSTSGSPRRPPQGPRYMSDFRLSELNWADLASGRELRTTLLLRFLPKALCLPGALERFLVKKDLAALVQIVRVSQGKASRLGSAVVNALDSDAVAKVGKFFHGCQWGTGRMMPVAVSFAAAEQQQQPVNHQLTAAMQSRMEPLRVFVEDCSAQGEQVASDVSTEVSDDVSISEAISEGEGPLYAPKSSKACQAKRSGQSESLTKLQPPPGLAPPPGLLL